MKRLILLTTVLLTLACITPAIVSNSHKSQQATPSATGTAPPTHFPTGTPVSVSLEGCWNVRSAPSVEAEILGVMCNEPVNFGGWTERGFFRVADGYICGRGIGFDVECR